MFCTTNECDSDSKKWCFLATQIVTKKLCDTNKNMTKNRCDYKRGLLCKNLYQPQYS
jgi:hypothetical protein